MRRRLCCHLRSWIAVRGPSPAVLQEQGRAGQRALLCYPPGVEFLVGLFGCLYAGTIAVPLYPPCAGELMPGWQA